MTLSFSYTPVDCDNEYNYMIAGVTCTCICNIAVAVEQRMNEHRDWEGCVKDRQARRALYRH